MLLEILARLVVFIAGRGLLGSCLILPPFAWTFYKVVNFKEHEAKPSSGFEVFVYLQG